MGLLLFKPRVCQERKGTYLDVPVSSGLEFIMISRNGEGYNLWW